MYGFEFAGNGDKQVGVTGIGAFFDCGGRGLGVTGGLGGFFGGVRT